MTDFEAKGESLYNHIVTPCFTNDGMAWTAGTIVRRSNGGFGVEFYNYRRGEGLVSKAPIPGCIMSMLKADGAALRAYVTFMDATAERCRSRALRASPRVRF